MKNILALDLGTKCGWAHTHQGIRTRSGIWDLKAKSSESIGQRYVNFEQHLRTLASVLPLDIIIYEEVKFHRGVDAAHVYGGFEAIAQKFALNCGIEYRGVGVSEIQKHATGRGMAPKGTKKAAMFEAAVRLFPGINVIDDNHADALCLLSWATKNIS